jgi:hypothetical protein
VEGSGLESACHPAEDAAAFREKISELFERPYSAADHSEREKILRSLYDNERNADLLMQWIY